MTPSGSSWFFRLTRLTSSPVSPLLSISFLFSSKFTDPSSLLSLLFLLTFHFLTCILVSSVFSRPVSLSRPFFDIVFPFILILFLFFTCASLRLLLISLSGEIHFLFTFLFPISSSSSPVFLSYSSSYFLSLLTLISTVEILRVIPS